ncbi:MAG TPA: redox-sensing transcriptional repressor Rex [Gemmatimonadaceae bacterium]|nr:redox-sensing transcriptional repressor Rex [Gemmatimonadaceae bacterium]
MKRIADSTVRRLSAYLRFLEDFEGRGLTTISSEELAKRGGTTSAQVRKDLSFFGSFGKRGLGYSVPELKKELREILGLGREWRVVIIGAGKIGAALSQYRGFRQRGFSILRAYDSNPAKIGTVVEGMAVSDIAQLEKDFARELPDIVVLTVPAEAAQDILDRVVKTGVKAVLNFAPTQLQAPADVTVKTVNMAMELESLSFALTNRD